MLVTRFVLFPIAVFAISASVAQPVITSAGMPNAGDLLAQEVAALNGEVDFVSSGPQYTWNFGTSQLTSSGVTNQTACVPIGQIPFTYQVFFNNPFLPEHYSSYFLSLGDVNVDQLQLEDVNIYYQNRTNRFAITGASATIMGIPTGAQSNPVDVVYQLPLEYGNESTSNSILIYNVPTLGSYRTNQVRQNQCDGWGTLNLLGTAYEVLRVKTTINSVDSIYIELLGFGQEIERPEVIEYKWLSPDFKVPVLQITTTSGIVSSVLIIGTPVSIVESLPAIPFTWFYDMKSEVIRLDGLFDAESVYRIHDVTGRLLQSGKLAQGIIDATRLPSGVLLFTVIENGIAQGGRFLKP